MLLFKKENKLKQQVKAAAEKYKLNWELVASIIWQESKGNARARRYENVFYKIYLESASKQRLGGHWPAELSYWTEKRDRAYSWGLMQVMGQTARERGFEGDMTEMLEPAVGIEIGCRVFARFFHQNSVEILPYLEREKRALLRYNGGGNKNYPDEVIAIWKEKTYESLFV